MSRRALAACALFPIVACSGGGGSSPTPSQSALSNGKLVLAIPERATSAHAKHSLFLSPSAASVSIAVSGVAQPFVADVSATSADCVTGAVARTCSIAVSAPAGSDTFVATLYAGANATGHVLGVGTSVASIASGTPFSLSIGVDGSVASIEIAAARKQFTQGLAASTTVSVIALDAGGNAIQGSYASSIALTNSDTTGTFTITPTTVASSTTVVTLSYSGGAAATTATISANAANVPLSSVSAQIVTITPSGPTPTPSPSPTPSPTPTATPKPTATPSQTPTPTATPTPAPLNLYTSQIGSNAMTVTPVTANGNAAPIREIAGANTQLDQPYDVGVDASGIVYLSSYQGGTVSVFPKSANGNVTPLRTIGGAATGLSGPIGVGFDPANDLVVANFGGSSITIFASGANGNATPVRTISGSNTGIAEAYGLTLDSAGTIYLVNNQSQFGGVDSITVYAPGANGNVAPIRTITGSLTGMSGAVYDALDASGDLFVSSAYNNSVEEFAPGANGNVAPIRRIVGTATGLTIPVGIVVDGSGNIYVANEGQTQSIEVFAPGANGNAAPIRTIAGGSTGIDGAGGMRLAP